MKKGIMSLLNTTDVSEPISLWPLNFLHTQRGVYGSSSNLIIFCREASYAKSGRLLNLSRFPWMEMLSSFYWKIVKISNYYVKLRSKQTLSWIRTCDCRVRVKRLDGSPHLQVRPNAGSPHLQVRPTNKFAPPTSSLHLLWVLMEHAKESNQVIIPGSVVVGERLIDRQSIDDGKCKK